MEITKNPESLLSIAVPCYNEEAVLRPFLDRLRTALAPIDINYEIIFANDGSKDSTLSFLLKERENDERIKIVDLSRNFGKEAALTAAILHCSGDAVIPIDVDLQEPPELIPMMIEKWRDGYDMVTARRIGRESDGIAKKTTARAFYRIFNLLSTTRIPYDTGDFRLMDRKVVQAFAKLGERKRFMKGIFAWLGFRQTEITFHREDRAAGKTKFSAWKLWRFATESIFAFSAIPLRMWTYIGVAVSTFAFCYAVLLIFITLVYGRDAPGYPSIMVAILFLGGVQLIGIGVLGEYIGHIYEEVKGRPLYIVKSSHGLAAESKIKTPDSPKTQPSSSSKVNVGP